MAFSSRSWKYHVFLSFRGEDTRNKFVGHLYTALKHMGIETYKDDKKLTLGESIGPSLVKAIRESQIAIIVFSENYADSSWCLNELVCIMKCKKETGLIVVPIFYDVEPSEVRKQKRKYGEAFAKYELEKNANFASWRKALGEACEFSGQDFKNKANMDESELIKDIVNKISKMVRPLTPRVNDNLIGVEARMHDLISKLQIGSDGVLMIGIWGVGGGGKTTLAKSVYRKISWEFDGCCCIDNIREQSSKKGLETLQEKMLLAVLKQNEVRVWSIDDGIDMIIDRLSGKKVLIVLDDVDHLDQLKALVGSHDWFGDGSRIIITTRDKHLLTVHKVNVIHNINLLNNDEAIKLFCKHAPRDNRPVGDYEHLSTKVVSYAGGLPLALTVLGSFLCDKDIDEWKSTLLRLKEIPDADIVEKLKISFDGLKPVEKELFLDIACFLRGYDKSYAMKSLDVCGFHPVIGVKVLIQKALITVSWNGKFEMHDLVQEMGHHIVRGEHPNNPEKLSRVWKKEDVLKICAMDATMELDMIQAIKIDYDRDNLTQHLPAIVGNAKNLRWIEWDGDFASQLPSNFPQRKLCHLRLSRSLQKQLWEGSKLLPNLKTIELHCLENLMMTPNFDGLQNLERFVLDKCPCLEEIHPSIGCLERLVFLSVENCGSLKMSPPITQPKNLETLSFIFCSNLFNVSELQQQSMGTLGHLRGMEFCEKEPSLPHNNMNRHIGLRLFLKDLRSLDLRWCNLGDEEIGCAVWVLPSLQGLNLEGNKFARLSFSRMQLPRLKYLDISWCVDLEELSELPSSIAVVIADGCDYLESFGDISKCKCLWKVSLVGQNKLGGDLLLDSLLQGNAIEDQYISINLSHQIPKGFVGRLFRVKTFTLHLPHDWYNNFGGFSVCIVTPTFPPYITIVIKQEVDEDIPFELWQESNEAVEPQYNEMTYVGYVSFGSLRNNTFLNSSYTMISVSLDDRSYVGAELVPRKSKGDQPQTTNVATDSSEFCDHELNYSSPPFTIQRDSNPCIKILWQP